MWKNRTFPHFPQLFPQGDLGIHRRHIEGEVYIIIFIQLDKTSTFLRKTILSMGNLGGEKLGIDKPFYRGTPWQRKKSHQKEEKMKKTFQKGVDFMKISSYNA